MIEKNMHSQTYVQRNCSPVPKFVVFVDRWSLFWGRFMFLKLKFGLQNGGHCRHTVIILRWSLAQVWLYKYFGISTDKEIVKIYFIRPEKMVHWCFFIIFRIIKFYEKLLLRLKYFSQIWKALKNTNLIYK